jgi:hypothetical protein
MPSKKLKELFPSLLSEKIYLPSKEPMDQPPLDVTHSEILGFSHHLVFTF